MQCKHCGYRLWNLASRMCPECGTPFRVRDFEFVPGTVAYCCPHCSKAYYGTDAKGHLVPPAFTCLHCHNAIDMESMLLRPSEGVDEERTNVAVIPWTQRHEIGKFRALYRTIRMSLLQPATLINASATAETQKDSWVFAAWSLLISILFGLGLIMTLEMVGILFVVPRGSMGVAEVIGVLSGLAAVLAIGVLLHLLFILIWGLVTQFMLWLSGKGHESLRRTYRALCYSSGAYVSSIVPCVGWYFGWIWWIVSAVLMVRATHRISGGRAALSVLTMPALMFVGAAVAYGLLIYSVFSSPGSPFTITTTGPAFSMKGPGSSEMQKILTADLDYARDHGTLPKHPVELLLDNRLDSTDFVSSESMTNLNQTRWPHLNPADLDGLNEAIRAKKIKAFVDKLPKKAFAYRAADYIFTCPGVDPSKLTHNVWLVIFSPMPGSGPASPWLTNVYVGLVDGSVHAIPQTSFQNAMQKQNVVRKKNGLPPLPTLQSITQAKPAVEES